MCFARQGLSVPQTPTYAGFAHQCAELDNKDHLQAHGCDADAAGNAESRLDNGSEICNAVRVRQTNR